jgi:calcium-dependent protein kinase
VITYILLSGRPPYKGKTRQEIFESIKNNPLAFEGGNWDKISEDAKDFIRLSLAKVPNERMGANELLKHRWLSQIVEPRLQKKISLDVTENLQEFRVSLIIISLLYSLFRYSRVGCSHLLPT